jgi:ribosomal protein L30/L7E
VGQQSASGRGITIPNGSSDPLFIPSPGPPSYDVNSLGGTRLVRLMRSAVHREWDQREAARSLGVRKIRSYSVIDPSNETHRGLVTTISHLVECKDLDIFVPAGKYRYIDYMDGIFFGKGDENMTEIRYGVDKATGSRFFEARGGEYLQWVPRDERTAALIWTMGHVTVSDLVEIVGADYKAFSGRLSGMVEYSGGRTVPLSSSEDAIAYAKDDPTSLQSLMVGFDDILIKWLSADQVSDDAPLESQYSQVSVICHRDDCEKLAEKWIAKTASPRLGKNAVEIAQRLVSG